MEQIPKVEKQEETEKRTSEEVIADIEKLKTELSEEEQTKVFNLKKDEPVKEAPVEKPKVEGESHAIKLDPQIQMVANTLMSTAEEKVKEIYADVDYSGILNADIDTLTKVTLMESVIRPNAIKMATIEKNLKSNDAEDTPTETKKAEFSKPEKSGKVDKEAGQKLYTEMSEKLGLPDEENDKGDNK